jgi:hypothetical protein
MQIDGITYEFTRASDLERDGMSLECERIDDAGGRTLVLEAFWHDPTGRFSVWSRGEELPFALVQAFLKRAAEACPPITSREVGTKVLVYVMLLDEDVDVWRPVTAEITSHGCYKITGNQPDDERWEFEPGMSVHCKERRFKDGTLGLVATERAG